MKTLSKQYFFAAPLLIGILIVCNSFKPQQKNATANGGGNADGIDFSFNVVQQKDGNATGYIHYADEDYTVNWALWMGNAAIFCTTDGHAFYVSDNGKPSGRDWISDPIIAQKSPWLSSSDFFGLHCVGNGNIQVKE